MTNASGIRDAMATAKTVEQRREKRELRSQRWEERIAHTRAVLFDGIELSAEQSRGVDAILKTQLEDGRRYGELRAELDTAQQQGDTERIRAIRAERRPLRERRKGPDESMEEMRVLLSEEQRPIFDMNRARLAAEDQQPRKRQRQRKPRTGAKAEAE